jgi:hypothetical protein
MARSHYRICIQAESLLPRTAGRTGKGMAGAGQAVKTCVEAAALLPKECHLPGPGHRAVSHAMSKICMRPAGNDTNQQE